MIDREAALITFMTCASGVTVFQMGSAFWGIVLGCASYLLFHWRSTPHVGK